MFSLLVVSLSCTPAHDDQQLGPGGEHADAGHHRERVRQGQWQPNIARTTVGVEARAATAEQAVSEVNDHIALVIAAVKKAGVADSDVRTATLSLNSERVYESPRPVEAALPPAPPPPG